MMNEFRASGGVAECGWAYKDARTPLLLFTLVVRDSLKIEHRLKFRVEDHAAGQRLEPDLTCGRWVEVVAEAVGVPVVRHGFVKGETTAFRVLELHFPAAVTPHRQSGPLTEAAGRISEEDESYV